MGQYRGGTGPRSQGRTQPAATNAYRASADREHPRPDRAGDVHAQHQDQERVDLHVEARPERRGGAGAPSDPAVDVVEDERDDDERHQQADRDGLRRSRRRPAPRPRRRASRGSASPGRPGRARARWRAGQAAGQEGVASRRPHVSPTSQPARPRPTVAGEDGEQRHLGDQPDQRAGSNRPHPASVSRRDSSINRYSRSTGRATLRFIPRSGGHAGGASTRSRSGCASPAWARSGRSPLPEPGPDEVLVRTLRSGVSRGTETLVFRGGVPASQYATMRAPFQEGDFPGPVKYGYLNVGVVEQGPAALLGRTVFCLYPHQTAYVVPAAVGRRRARRRTGRAGRARRAPWRPRSTPCGTPRRWSATGSPSSARAWSAAASPGSWPGSPAPRSRWSTSTRRGPTSPRRSASTSRCRTTPPAAATWSSTPARRRPGCSARWTCSPRRAPCSSSAGTATARSPCPWAGRSTPGGSASGQPGRRGRAGPTRDPHACRPARAGARPAPRPGLRRAAHRRIAVRRAARGHARLADGSLPALCHTITYGEG